VLGRAVHAGISGKRRGELCIEVRLAEQHADLVASKILFRFVSYITKTSWPVRFSITAGEVVPLVVQS